MRGDGTHCSAGFLKLRVYIEMGAEHRAHWQGCDAPDGFEGRDQRSAIGRESVSVPAASGAYTKRAHGADMGIAVGTASEGWCDDRNECCHTA